MKTDMDYVVLYAEKLREDNSIFKQQKTFIESQMKSSKDMFRNLFGKGEVCKKKARVYLKSRDLI